MDLTAVSNDDIIHIFSWSPYVQEDIQHGDDEQFVPVVGLLFPDVKPEEGLDPDELQAFNEAQSDKRRQFADYYQALYGETYQFAKDERKLAAWEVEEEESAEGSPGRLRNLGLGLLRYFGLSS